MKKQMNRLLSLVLSLVMVLGMLPAVAPHVHATEHINGVTLTSSTGKVTPTAVLDNVVVYDIWTAENYTLTTTPGNTYGVFFRTYYSREWIVDDWYDEGGYYETDDLAEITLDNVTIRTQNPRHAETEGDAVNRYGALTFWAAEMEWNDKNQQGKEYMGVIVDVKGTNTVELRGAENDTADAKWSAVSFVNCYGNFYGRGSNATLNATIAYDNAVGEAAALRGTSSINFGDTYNEYDDETPVTINVVAQVTGADGTTKYGNGIDIIDYSLNCAGDTNLNIVANDTGILRRYIKYCNPMYFNDSAIRINAGKAAMISVGEPEPWNSTVNNHVLCSINFTNCTLNADGIYNGEALVDPLDSGINAAGSIDFKTTTATVTAVNIALNSAYDFGGDQSYNHHSYVQVRDNSVVTVTGSMGEQEDAFSSKIAAIDTEAYYAAVYVQRGSKLTVNAGWLAIKTLTVQSGADCEIWVNTTYPSDGGALSCSYLNAFGASASDENSKPLKLRINSAAAQLGVGKSCEFDSNDVLIHTAGGAPISPLQGSHTIYRGEGIVVMESADGENWQPVSADRNSLDTMRWLTTIPQSSHVCANDDPDQLTFDEATSTHSGPCLVCGQTFTHDCVLEDEIPAYTKHPDATTDGVRYWECLICEGETPETVPAHECEDYSDNNWVQHEDWPSELHVAHCTFTYGDGKLCDNTINRDHVMTGEFHVDADTIRDECTVCDFFREYTGTASAVGVPAKDATCTAPGNVACWSCSHCGNYFADEACSRILTPGEVFTQPAAHSYGEDGVCTVCGEKVIRARFAETPEDTFSSEDEYLYVLAGKDADGNVYVMGEAMDGGKREAVKVDGANIDQNGVLTLRSDEVEFMDFEYYFEDGASASTTSTFTVDGGYMTVRNGKVYVFPRERLDDPANPRPFEFCQASYGDDSGLGSVEADLYDPETYKHDCEYMTFNAETLCFEACESEEYTVYLYREICDHRPDDVIHYNDAPTCTEQGIREHWACDKCGKLFSDGSATTPYVFPEYVDPDSYRDVDEYFHLPALGHRFGADDTCENCGMSRPVYRPVTTLEEFDKLSEDAYYLIVFKDLEGLATVPDVGGGEGGDAIPSSESGVEEVIPGEDDGSGDTPPPTPETGGEAGSDRYSEKTFAAALPMLTNPYESEALNAANIVEVTVVADGSITVTDEGAMEFQMMESGVWGGAPFDKDELPSEAATYGVDLQTERIRAAWVPNVWVANYGHLGYNGNHLLTQYRTYGDGFAPGVIDNKNWKISFREDGTACLVSVWTTYDDTAALQLVRYTDENGDEPVTMVGCYGSQWPHSAIMQNAVYSVPAFLYAAEPTYGHKHSWGDWTDNGDNETHSRICAAEGCTVSPQTRSHRWIEGNVIEEPTCTQPGTQRVICADCGAVGTVSVEPLGHYWSYDWTYEDETTHIRECMNECGIAPQTGTHTWDEELEWVDDQYHAQVCTECYGRLKEEHEWIVEVIQAPSCVAPGQTRQCCPLCNYEQPGEMPIDPDAHDWGEWTVTRLPSVGIEGEEQRVCANAPTEHVETKRLPAIALPMEDTTISFVPSYEIPEEQTVSVHAYEVDLAYDGIAEGDPTVGQEVTPYEEYILNGLDGKKVETVFEIQPMVTVNDTTLPYEVPAGQSFAVTLFVGEENAKAIAERTVYLVHITTDGAITYYTADDPNKPGDAPIVTVLTDENGVTGDVTFSADSFSPFVLVSLPGENSVKFNAAVSGQTCTVSFTEANQSFLCNLFIAVYDSSDRMLAVKSAGDVNLAANPQYMLEFTGTASYVKAFMLKPDGSLIPRCETEPDDVLND